jgi:hypothetical protein
MVVPRLHIHLSLAAIVGIIVGVFVWMTLLLVGIFLYLRQRPLIGEASGEPVNTEAGPQSAFSPVIDAGLRFDVVHLPRPQKRPKMYVHISATRIMILTDECFCSVQQVAPGAQAYHPPPAYNS